MPYWRSQLRTALTPSEVQARLAALTIAPESAYLGLPLRKGRSMFDAATADDGYRFVGVVNEHDFSLNRCGPYDGTLRAEMQGRVISTSSGSTIHLTQYMPWRITAIVALIGLACLFGPLAIGHAAWPPALESIVAVSVIVLMMIGAFARDVATNRRSLHALLDAAPIASTSKRPPTVRR